MTYFVNTNRFTRWLSRIALTLALAPLAAQATPAWQINTMGTGVSGAETVSSVTVGGVGFVQIIPDANMQGGFTFLEHGAYQLLSANGSTPFGAQDITVAYTVLGGGYFDNYGNMLALQFNSGSINLFVDATFDFATSAGNYGADNGTPLASFSIFGGGVDANRLASVNAQLIQGSLLAGYLFDANDQDLANADNVLMQLAIYNQPITPSTLQVSELVSGMAGSTGPGCDGSAFANTPFAFVVSDGGSLALSSVPEPGSLGLLLAGLVMIPVVAKRRRALPGKAA